MSSQKVKKNRACDSCRKRKSRCNGSDVPGGRCAGCITHSVECTYNDPPLERGPRHPDRPSPRKPSPKTYVQALETRISNLERLIQHYERKGTPQTSPSSCVAIATSDSEPEDSAEPCPKYEALSPRAFKKSPDIDPLSPSEELDCSEDEFFVYPGQYSDKIRHIEDRDKALLFGYKHDPLRAWRMEFWDPPEWFAPMLKSPPVQFEFPERGLILHLVDCYFENLDVVLPLLHRPSFTRSIVEGLHELDQNFGATVLLVCAIGCRYTDHPSVVHELSTSTSCTAWNLYNQGNKIRKPPYLPHSLHEVQIYPLSVLFLEAFSPPETAWLIIGTGLRIMQNNGVHRKSFSKEQSVENELWKRAFWVSVVLDRAFSTLLGRACVLQDEDFDADLPIVCNDEDLDDAVPKPPSGVDPLTKMRCFVATIQLNQILAFALRTIYSTRKSRVILGYSGESWEKRMVATLDSALNKWVDAVPAQLRWGSEVPKCQAELIQSAFLWTQFYEIQLHIHRMFALKEPPDPDLSASSMIICRNASKQCIAIIESTRDVMITPFHNFLMIKSVFTSILFLILMFWKKKGFDYNSPEFRAIDAGALMIGETMKKRSTSLHLQDIARALRVVVERSCTDQKLTLSGWAKMRFEGARYIDQDGVLTGEGKARSAGSGTAHTSKGASPLMSAGLKWSGGQEPAQSQCFEPGLEGIPMGDCGPGPTVEFLPMDFFTDPSVLFSGPSSTGFTRVGDQGIIGDSYPPYDLPRFF